jgi:hypothetical protein
MDIGVRVTGTPVFYIPKTDNALEKRSLRIVSVNGNDRKKSAWVS